MIRHPAHSDVLIVGGGIAGLAAALRLAEAGVRVTLLETRKKLGGRATSFTDPRTGEVLDNCQHVVLGCCTNYLDFLGRLGVRDQIRWHAAQYWIDAGGTLSVIRRGGLPAPMHFGLSMLRSPLLSLSEAASIGRACTAILRAHRSHWHRRTFAEFLAACGQSDRCIRRFWAPVVISACNLEPARVSASAALHVFQEGFLASPTAADIGIPGVPLVDLYRRATEILESAGGRVVLGAGIERVTPHAAIESDGTRHHAAVAVLAVPVERVNRLIDEPTRAADPRFAPLERFTHSPILGVHMTFDRPILAGALGARSFDGSGVLPHAVLVDRPTQWIFRKDFDADPASAGSGVHAVISAADAWMDLTEPEIAERVLSDLRACIPDASRAAVVRVRAVKEKLATFAPVPGLDDARPGPAGPSGIILAGDYTATGWPATMEGATRSGYAAAAAVLGVDAGELLAPPLETALLPRAFGLRPTTRGVAPVLPALTAPRGQAPAFATLVV